MELNLTTPALLFSALSLILLAYNGRFLALASLMRELYTRYKTQPDPRVRRQLENLRYRIGLIRNMQVSGVASFFLSVLCMFLLFEGLSIPAKWVFSASLLLLLVSLGISLREVQVSVDALSLQIHDLDEQTTEVNNKNRKNG
jgi:hypothetical protein